MTIVAIGNFDGVHCAHQALLNHARAINGYAPLHVLTFEPHPRSFFQAVDTPFRLTPHEIKAERLKICGVDQVITLNFDEALSSLSAEEFIDQILVRKCQVTHVVVGPNFRFGKGRAGDIDTLRPKSEFHTHVMEMVTDVSSSDIRAALKMGKIDRAHAMLGWDWYIEGIVQKGDQRGREWGFPTLNVPLGDTLCPSYGIYAVKVEIAGKIYHGVANIGIRPMFGLKTPLIEAHLFDFEADVYGQNVCITPVQKLRDEAHFDTEDALVAQIDRDAQAARHVLNT